ncbi:hypothetical protein [Mangrovimonas sp. DI 80]|uniref:hypothetical protein n=1 Tax=Mangrovimonas sp. DI 80 TaxID=1779330 RepID=UPI00097773A5|nr:hypothetical protein [Mangrovimonas sp. DI 80]OMP29940.1 hypothetical protein BKM32_15160 [Mangrovimonas sp. DI 80]
MENEFYICHYCQKEYTPKRRRAQKFCSNSCRSKAHHAKGSKPTTEVIVTEPKEEKKQTVESMSIAGVGNAATGTAIVELIKSFLTPELKKNVTKEDLNTLVTRIKGRYHPIKNHPSLPDGKKPFYDMETQEIVYWAPAPWLKH